MVKKCASEFEDDINSDIDHSTTSEIDSSENELDDFEVISLADLSSEESDSDSFEIISIPIEETDELIFTHESTVSEESGLAEKRNELDEGEISTASISSLSESSLEGDFCDKQGIEFSTQSGSGEVKDSEFSGESTVLTESELSTEIEIKKPKVIFYIGDEEVDSTTEIDSRTEEHQIESTGIRDFKSYTFEGEFHQMIDEVYFKYKDISYSSEKENGDESDGEESYSSEEGSENGEESEGGESYSGEEGSESEESYSGEEGSESEESYSGEEGSESEESYSGEEVSESGESYSGEEESENGDFSEGSEDRKSCAEASENGDLSEESEKGNLSKESEKGDLSEESENCSGEEGSENRELSEESESCSGEEGSRNCEEEELAHRDIVLQLASKILVHRNILIVNHLMDYFFEKNTFSDDLAFYIAELHSGKQAKIPLALKRFAIACPGAFRCAVRNYLATMKNPVMNIAATEIYEK